MTDVSAIEPVRLEGEAYYQDPWGFFARLRESRPVAVRMPGYGRAWVVTRYADGRAALADPRLSRDMSRWPGGARLRPSEARGVATHMLHADPPDHTRLRRPVQKAFTPGRVARLRPRTKQIAAGLADGLAAADGAADLLAAYARPLPVTVLCELLGVPEADRPRIAATVLRYDEAGEMPRVEDDLAAYFTELIAARRSEPGDDLPGSQDRSVSTSAATPAATSRSGTASTTAWALPWPGWRPRSPSEPCSTVSLECRSRSRRRNSAGVRSA